MPLAREVYEEGLRIPPVHLVRAGKLERDVLALIQYVRERVQAEYDVWLETEVRIIGEDEPQRVEACV